MSALRSADYRGKVMVVMVGLMRLALMIYLINAKLYGPQSKGSGTEWICILRPRKISRLKFSFFRKVRAICPWLAPE